MKKLNMVLNASLIGLTSSLATQNFMNGNTTTAILWTIAAVCWFASMVVSILNIKED